MTDESTILRFRHLLEKHDLALAIFAEVNAVLSEKGLSMKRGTVVDAKTMGVRPLLLEAGSLLNSQFLTELISGEDVFPDCSN